jgi:hypothetical protein
MCFNKNYNRSEERPGSHWPVVTLDSTSTCELNATTRCGHQQSLSANIWVCILSYVLEYVTIHTSEGQTHTSPLKEYSDMIKNGYVKQDGCAVAEAGQSPAAHRGRPGSIPT